MAVPRTKKPKGTGQKKREIDLVSKVQELYKSIIYLYLADVKKYDQAQLEDIDKFFARQVLAISGSKIDIDDIHRALKEKGVDMKEVNKKTDDFIDKYGEMWS